MPRDTGRLTRDAQRRTAQAVRAMAGGSMGGRTAQAAPLPERPRAQLHKLPTPSGGKRYATVVIGHADRHSAAEVDFLCDGTDDEVTWRAAIESIDAWPYIGEVHVLEGDYSFGADLNLAGLSGFGLSLHGGGIGVTEVTGGGIDLADLYYISVHDIGIRGSGCNVWTDDFVGYAHLANLEVGGYVRFTAGCEWSWIDHCTINGQYTDADGDWAVDLGAPFWTWITDCFLDAGLRVAEVGASENYQSVIRGNTIEGDLWVSEPYWVRAHDNICDNLVVVDATQPAGSIFHNNIAWSGARVAGSRFVHLLDNDIEWSLSSGVPAILVDGSSDCTVAGNAVLLRSSVDYAGAVIDLTGDSDRNHVYGNTGRQAVAGDTEQADYFLRIGASCNDTKAWGNDGFGCWDTAAVLDLGTGSDLTAANR